MREVTDDALQRLYWASRRRTGFPGQVPDESMGTVSTTDIMKGLGLIKPEFDEFELPKEFEPTIRVSKSTDDGKQPLQPIKPREHGEFNNHQSIMSRSSTCSSPLLSEERGPSTNVQLSISEPPTPNAEFDMKEQFLAYSPVTRPAGLSSKITGSEEQNPYFHQARNAADSHNMEVDEFLDMSFCAPPSLTSQTPYSTHPLMPYTMPPTTAPQFSQVQAHQSPPEIMFDSYLSPWPGSLAAAHQSVATRVRSQLCTMLRV